jgi:predicted RND superfamily exporter protein
MRALLRPWGLALMGGMVLVAVALLAVGTKDLIIDNDVRNMAPSVHPDMVFCDEVDDLFGSTDAIIVGLRGAEGLTPPVMRLVRELTKTLSQEYEDVISVDAADTIIVEGKILKPVPLLDEGEITEESVAGLRARLGEWDVFENMLVSGDGKVPALIVTLPVGSDLPMRQAAVEHVRKVVADAVARAGLDIEPAYAGEPVLSLEIGERINADITLLSPLALVVVLLVLMVSLRSIPGVLGPLVTVALAVGATFGLMGFLGRPVMVISSSIPVFLVAVGSAYGIHIVSHYLRYRQEGRGAGEAAGRTVRGVGPAVIGAAVTTVAGFLSLAVTDIVPMRDFGVFLAFGIVVALLASLTVVPVIMILSRRTRARGPGPRDPDGWLSGALQSLALFAARRRWVVVPVVVLVAAAMLTATLVKLRVDQDAVAMMPEESAIRQDDAFFRDHFGGTHTLAVVIAGSEPRTMMEPAILQFMADLQVRIEEEPLVGKTTSLADFVSRMNRVMREDRPEAQRIPESRELVAQYMQLYELSGDPEDFSSVVDFEYRQGQVLVQMRSGAASMAQRLRSLVQGFADERLPDGYTVRMAGTAVRYDVVNSFIVSSQLWSLGLSLLLVLLVVTLLFLSGKVRAEQGGKGRHVLRALSAGGLTLVPIAFAVVANFGTMALAGIPLEVGTAIIAACAIGIGIDYSVHFLHRYEVARGSGMGCLDGIRRAAGTSGRPIVFNAVAVAAGFMTMLLSEFMPLRYLGWLTALTMLVTSASALIVLPALLAFRDGSREPAENR